MKRFFVNVILCTLCMLLFFPSCKSKKLSSAAESVTRESLELTAVYPDWLVEIPLEINDETKGGPYKNGRKGYEQFVTCTKQYRFLAYNGNGHEYYPFWLYTLGINLLCLDEDHLAFQELTKLVNLPDSSLYTTKVKRLKTLEQLKELPKSLRIRIMARRDLKDDVEKALETYVPKQNYAAFNVAMAYMLIGEKNKSIEQLKKALEPEIFIRLYKRSSATAGAAGMAYAMGKYDDVFSLSEWMIQLGRDVSDKNYMESDEKGKPDSYRVNQWQSSYDIVLKFRILAELAGKGLLFRFDSLNDGKYSGACRGFIDTIGVEIVVAKGSISDVTVVSDKEDRPYASLKTIPDRILKRKSLEVDAMTSATITSHAILAATAEAALKAQ